MKLVYDTIIACRNTSSKNDKVAILTKQKDNADLREFLRVCYEPRINFYISKVPAPKAGDAEGPWKFNRELLESIIEKLAERRLTGNKAKDWLAFCHYQLENEWEREMLTMLIERDVKAGFSESTINKVFGEIITEVPYMRCSLPKDSNINKFDWKRGVYSQIKADGMFANISHFDNGTVRIESRNGSPFPLDYFEGIVADVKKYVPPGAQLHGELLMMSGGKYLDRQTGNGLFNKILKGGDFDTKKYTPVYEAWDIIPLDEARLKNKYKVPYANRFATLKMYLPDTFSSAFHHIRIIETRIVNSLAEANAHYREALERGLEGTIVKSADAIWQDSTSKDQVKMKLEFEVDLEVEGYEEGNGKAAGTLGALRCRTSDGKLKVKVGSGFTDAMRRDIWERKDLKIITVKANSIMPPENKDTYSLFLPIFVEERNDKKTADDLARVLAQYEAAIGSM